MKAAIRWLRANAERYGINATRIGVVGFSFGAYLALIAASTGADDGLEGDTGSLGYSSEVQVAVAAGAPVDWAFEMRRMSQGQAEMRGLVSRFMGGLPEEVPETYQKSDASKYLDFSDPPILAIYGGRDTAVVSDQGRIVAERMLAEGVKHSFLVVPRATHNFGELASPLTDYPMWSFLDMYLKAK